MASVAQQKKKSKRKKQKKSNHTVLFHSGDMEDQRRTLLSFLCFPHILLSAHLKHTPFTSLIFCLLICFASKLSAVPAVSRISASSSLSPHITVIPSIDPSLLPFFLLSPASCYLSSLSNLPVVSSPPTLPNLSASLPPSFCLHILCGRTSSFCSSLSPFFLLRLSFTVSPSFLLCPFPPHPPAHSISVLSSVLLFLAPSLQGDWQESLALPQATCLCAPHSSIHLPLHFLKNVLWMAAIRKTREGRLPGELRCRFGEQDSSVVPKMCHYGNLC